MRRFVLLFAIFAAGGPGLALAQSAWPQKPVRVLVGLAPGGNPDTLARMLAANLGGALGQQFVVENRPGAGSTVAADITAKSAPDGYTVLVSDSSVVTMAPHLYKSLPYDPFRDLQPVTLAVVVPMWLVANPSVPANSVAELVALARSQKQPMPYASSGNGSIHHITMERFKTETGTDFAHVPYKGAGQSVPALIAGDMLLGFVGYPHRVRDGRAGLRYVRAARGVRRRAHHARDRRDAERRGQRRGACARCCGAHGRDRHGARWHLARAVRENPARRSRADGKLDQADRDAPGLRTDLDSI